MAKSYGVAQMVGHMQSDPNDSMGACELLEVVDILANGYPTLLLMAAQGASGEEFIAEVKDIVSRAHKVYFDTISECCDVCGDNFHPDDLSDGCCENCEGEDEDEDDEDEEIEDEED